MLVSQKDNFIISTDKEKLDLDVICHFLATSYWAFRRTREQIAKSIEHAVCFGVYDVAEPGREKQIGFGRVMTDFAVLAYLGDVFILPEFQGRGLGKWLVESILQAPEVKTIPSWILLTNDAQTLYKKFGFKQHDNPERFMVRRPT